MRIGVNLDDVQENLAWTPGWYKVRVTGAEVKRTKDGESEYIAVELENIEAEEERFQGRPCFVNLSLKRQALFKVKQFMKAANVPWSADGFDTSDMLGAELEVFVDNREYEGALRNEVKKFRPIE